MVAMSTNDTLLVGIPMVLLLLVTFFRLDEVVVQRPRMVARRPLAGGVDQNGMPICVDPDGKPLGRIRAKG
jgi:hypothetical protein